MSRAGIETASGERVGQSGDKGLFEWFAAPKAVATDLFLIEVDFATICRRLCSRLFHPFSLTNSLRLADANPLSLT
jgi:hypothetical protein